MSNELWVPEGLSDGTAERWSKAVGEAGRRWFKGVGGPLMTRVTSETRFFQAARLIESSAVLGFASARWNEVQRWPHDKDAGHPWVYLRRALSGEEAASYDDFTDRVAAEAKLIDLYDGAGLAEESEVEQVDRGYLLFGDTRERLQYYAETAPTAFALGAALGWIALGDWHHEIYGESGRSEVRIVK